MEHIIHVIKGLIVLDKDGGKVYSQYYTSEFKDKINEQQKLEKNLFSKSAKLIGTTSDRKLVLFYINCVS